MTDHPAVALVGFGYAGRTFHAPLIAACRSLRLHIVVSSKPEAVTASYPEARVATVEEALADPTIELVVIATPNDSHFTLARAALLAGKAVVVDKPFTLTVTEAEALTALAARQGRLLSVFHNRRWDADFLAVKALIDAGRLGRVVRFESHFNRYRPRVRGRWRETAGLGAGIWYDLGPHLIDQALQLFGLPLGLTCDLAIHREHGEAHDYAHAILRYEGLRVLLHADMLSAASDLRLSVHGDRGSFLKEGLDVQEAQLVSGLEPGSPGWGEDPRPGTVTDGESGAREPFGGPPGNYLVYYERIAAALRREGLNPVPPEEASAVMAIIEAGVRSSERRAEAPISWSGA
ncbi:MAG TPA: oxidoreductase [Caulobacteraceae bacterium]